MTFEATRTMPALPNARFDEILPDLAASPVEEWPAHLKSVSILDVAHLLTFDPAKYTRRIVAANDDIEILVMGWLPGQASAIHDHGASQGAALVLAGEAEEETFSIARGLAKRRSIAPLKRGQSTIERPADVHRILNASTQLLVTLHAYAPRLSDYATYESA